MNKHARGAIERLTYFDLLDEADPASAGSYFFTSPKCGEHF